MLQPYGGLFFASAAAFDSQVPAVTASSTGTVVLLRLRGFEELGSTFATVLGRYAEELNAVGSKLVIVSANERVLGQLEATGATAVIGEDNLYEGEQWIGRTLRQAHADALSWVQDPTNPPS